MPLGHTSAAHAPVENNIRALTDGGGQFADAAHAGDGAVEWGLGIGSHGQNLITNVLVLSNTFMIADGVSIEPVKTPASFAERLQMALDDPEFGMTQVQLAKAAGFKNQSAIGNMISDPLRKGSTRVYQIAKALNVEVAWLTDGHGPMRPGKPMHSADPAANVHPTREQARMLAMLNELPEAKQLEIYARVVLAYEDEHPGSDIVFSRKSAES